MKRIVFTAFLIVFMCAGVFARKLVAEGKSFTTLGSFKIETADKPLVINGVPLDTYVITYENSKWTVTIAIEQSKKCRKYLTISDKLSVQYVCYGTHFGVEKLSPDYSPYGFTTSDAALSRSSYFHQKVLSRGEKDPVLCMKLIGAYFPELLINPDGIMASR
jgi:hypothetical protein